MSKKENNVASVNIKIDGLTELKKLLDLASEQSRQLEKTLSRINDVKIRVVLQNIPQ